MSDFLPYTVKDLERSLSTIEKQIYSRHRRPGDHRLAHERAGAVRPALLGRGAAPAASATSGATCSTAPGSTSAARSPRLRPGSRSCCCSTSTARCAWSTTQACRCAASPPWPRSSTISLGRPGKRVLPLSPDARAASRSKSGPTPAATTSSATCKATGRSEKPPWRSATRKCAVCSTTSRCCSTA